MDATGQIYRADFDRIALLAEDTPDHNQHYFEFLLRQIPPDCGEVLEIGCGPGSLTRLLAKRSTRVVALDFAPNMINSARERSADCSNIEFLCADAIEWNFPSEQFDCVVSIATLHHLPMDEILLKMKAGLRPGGTIVILDLFQTEGLIETFFDFLALPVSGGLRFLRTGRLRPPRAVRDIWEEHGRNDSYLSMSEIRTLCNSLLPGAVVRRHLLWRYSMVWRKPANHSY